MRDFARYKTRLIEYLAITGTTGVENGKNFRCPLHKDGSDPTRWSAIVRGDSMRCYGCGFHGDIYDLAGAFSSIPDDRETEKYDAVARAFGDSPDTATPYTPPAPPAKAIPAPEPDAAALAVIDAYLDQIKPYYADDIAAFFSRRGIPSDLIPACANQVAYWPGFSQVLAEGVKLETLNAAMVPEKAFYHSGVIIRLAVGYKLHYFDDAGKTVKRGSHKSTTFPFPDIPEGTIILCEGELDQISARAAGFDTVRAIGGVESLTKRGAAEIVSACHTVIYATDNDNAGRAALGLEKRHGHEKDDGTRAPDFWVKHPIPKVIQDAEREAGKTLNHLFIDWKDERWAELVEGEKDLDDMVKHGKSAVMVKMIEEAKEVESEYFYGQDGRRSMDGEDGRVIVEGVRVVDERKKDARIQHDTGSARTPDNGDDKRHEGLDRGDAGNDKEGKINDTTTHSAKPAENAAGVRRPNDGSAASAGNGETGNNRGNPGDGENIQSTGSARGYAVTESAGTLNTSGPADDLGPINPQDIPFQFLGYDQSAYYVMPKNQNIPKSISWGEKAISDKLFELAPRDWWEALFTKTVYTKTGEPVEAFDKDAAIEWFRIESTKRGMYDDERILGLGAHLDSGRVVVNTGRAIIAPDGSVSTYEGYTGKGMYCRSKVEIVLGDTPWTTADGSHLVEQIKTFSFDNPLAYLVIPGFCALAPYASMLYRRPHLWLTGARGLGKSYLMHEIMMPLIGEQAIFADAGKGGVTEAGLRQTAGADSRTMFIDEFEANKKTDLAMVDNILALARTSYGGERTIKGSSSQKAISFATKMMFCFGSVNVNIQDTATRSRIAVCRMQPSKGKARAIRNTDGLRARMFFRLPTIREEIKACSDMIEAMGFDCREADTYAPLLVGYWAVMSDAPFGSTATPEDAAMLEEIREMTRFIYSDSEKEPDEERIFSRILQEKVRVSSDNEKTVAQMLECVDDFGKLVYDQQIQYCGLRRMTGTAGMGEGVAGREVIAVCTKHQAISKMLEDTPFSNYKEVLKRNSAVIGASNSVRVAGVTNSVILLDWRQVKEKYFVEYEDKVPF